MDFRDADELLKEILAKKLDEEKYEDLSNASDKYSGLLKDFRNTLFDRSRARTAEAQALTEFVKARLGELDRTIASIQEHTQSSDSALKAGRENIDALTDLVEKMQADYKVSLTIDMHLEFKLIW